MAIFNKNQLFKIIYCKIVKKIKFSSYLLCFKGFLKTIHNYEDLNA